MPFSLTGSGHCPPLLTLHYAAIYVIHFCTRKSVIQFVYTLEGNASRLLEAELQRVLLELAFWVGGANLRAQLLLWESTMPPATPTTFI